MEPPGLDRLGERHGVARALDVGRVLAFRVGGHVVDRREVEEVVDLSSQLGDPVVAAEPRLGDVADDFDNAVLPAPAVAGAPPAGRGAPRTST